MTNTLLIFFSILMSALPIIWTFWLWEKHAQEAVDRDPFVHVGVSCYCGRYYSIPHYEFIDKLSRNPSRRTLENELFCCTHCRRPVWQLLLKTRWVTKCLRMYRLHIADPAPRPPLEVAAESTLRNVWQREAHPDGTRDACGAETFGGFHDP